LQQSYFEDVTLDVGLSFTGSLDPFGNGAFRAGRDFKEQRDVMNHGDYAITVATAKCLVFRATVSTTMPPCLTVELLRAIETLRASGYTEQGMNDFFDQYGTHAIMEADFGSKFVTSAKYSREDYYANKFKNSKVIFGTKSDHWGI